MIFFILFVKKDFLREKSTLGVHTGGLGVSADEKNTENVLLFRDLSNAEGNRSKAMSVC